jgi:hypothetical protein
LLKIVANTVNRCTLNELENYENELKREFACTHCNEQLPVPLESRNNQKLLLLSEDTSKELFDLIDVFSYHALGPNRFISSEAKNVIRSLLSISHPPREIVELHVQQGTHGLEIRRKQFETLGLENLENGIIDGCEEILKLFRELLN